MNELLIDKHSNLDEAPKSFLSGKSQFQKVIYYMIPFIWHSCNEKVIKIRSKLVVARGQSWEWWGEGGGCSYKRATGEILVVIDMFYILTVSISISWLWYCPIVLQDISIGVNWIKDTGAFSIWFLTTACVRSFPTSYDLATSGLIPIPSSLLNQILHTCCSLCQKYCSHHTLVS